MEICGALMVNGHSHLSMTCWQYYWLVCVICIDQWRFKWLFGKANYTTNSCCNVSTVCSILFIFISEQKWNANAIFSGYGLHQEVVNNFISSSKQTEMLTKYFWVPLSLICKHWLWAPAHWCISSCSAEHWRRIPKYSMWCETVRWTVALH